MDAKKLLGENIKKYRKKLKLTQEELAEKIDISSKHLSNIEIGQKFVSSDLLERISESLGTSISALFYSVKDTPLGDDPLMKIDRLIEEYSKDFVLRVKEKIREEI